jgi:F0F1-type ATP synthase membrane subunit b/b'
VTVSSILIGGKDQEDLKMAKLKPLLIICPIVVITLIAGNIASSLTIEDAIAQAHARVEQAIAQAQAQAEEAIAQAQAQINTQIEAITAQNQAQIEDIITQAQTQINEAIVDVTAQVEQAINENLTLNETISNDAIARINEEMSQAMTQMEQAINDNPKSSEETIQNILSLLRAEIDSLLVMIRGTVTQQTTDTDCAATLIEHDIKRAITAIANRLNQTQIKDGVHKGSWPNEADWTGSIVAGLVSAYQSTGDVTYKAAAELGGSYIISTANGNFSGDEAFALFRLSLISSTPLNNQWRTALSNFYRNVSSNTDGTQGFLSQLKLAEASTAVFNLANHVVAAYYVDAEDKDIWRKALISYMSRINDCCSDSQVMSLGIATWALAKTGPLDDTLIDPCEQGGACWKGKKLADLSAILYSYQVCDGEPFAGCFYRRFDHGNGSSGNPVNGYAEDAIFATLGLISASRVNPLLHLDAGILAAYEALLEGINNEGKVFELLWIHNFDCYTFCGEMLQVLAEFTY